MNTVGPSYKAILSAMKKSVFIREVASLERDNLVVFYYLCVSEIRPYKRGITVLFFYNYGDYPPAIAVRGYSNSGRLSVCLSVHPSHFLVYAIA